MRPLRPAWLLSVLLLSCKREDVVLCETSLAHFRAVHAQASEAELKAEDRRCLEAVDKLKTGPKDCLVRCYAKAADRDALLDCDRSCCVSVQAPPQ